MKSLIVFTALTSLNAAASSFNVGTYVGTLKVGNNETGKACTVEVLSKSVSSQGAGCFKYIVSSKDLEIKNLDFEMHFDTVKGYDRSCSNRAHPEHIESKAKAYMVDDEGEKSVFINRMNFILSHKVLNCHSLVQVK